jgi:hypothetical protein
MLPTGADMDASSAAVAIGALACARNRAATSPPLLLGAPGDGLDGAAREDGLACSSSAISFASRAAIAPW